MVSFQEKYRIQENHVFIVVEKSHPFVRILITSQKILNQETMPKIGIVKPVSLPESKLFFVKSRNVFLEIIVDVFVFLIAFYITGF